MTVALLSDTHGLLRPEVVEGIRGVERILHMGDVGTPEVLADLEEIAPVTVVRGNVDYGPLAELPETVLTEVYGVEFYLLHNRSFLDMDPAAAGVKFLLYGHTHQPADEVGRGGVRYINPGSIGPRRFSLPISYAMLEPDLSVRFVTIEP